MAHGWRKQGRVRTYIYICLSQKCYGRLADYKNIPNFSSVRFGNHRTHFVVTIHK